MAPTKTAKACRAMKTYGISEETVKSVLKDILPVYGRNWKYIEDENYRVLIDAIFDSHASKKEEVKEQNSWLVEKFEEEEEECEQPLKKSRLRKQTPPSSADDSSPCARTRSSFFKQHREEIPVDTNSAPDDYEGKGKKPQICLQKSEGYSVSPKVFQRKKRRTLDTELGRGPRGHDGKACAIELPLHEIPLAIILPDGSSTGNFYNTEEICLQSSKIFRLDAGDLSHPSPLAVDNSLGCSDAKESGLKSSYLTSRNEDETYRPSWLVEQTCSNGNRTPGKRNGLDSLDLINLDAAVTDHPSCLVEQTCSNGNSSGAQKNGLDSLDFIDLDADENSPSEQFCEDGTSAGNSSGFEGKPLAGLDSQHEHMEDNVDDSQLPLKVDIASSLKGEVKLSFIYNSPQPCKFQIPSLDAVLKHVEDKCRKSFRISDTGFSLSKLLKEMCECFLEQGTVFMDAEQVPSTLDTRMSSNEQPAIPIMSNCLVPYQNLTKCPPDIPRFVASNRLNNLHCIIGLNFDWNSFGHRFKSTRTFDSQEPLTSSSLAIAQNFDSSADPGDTPYYVVDITKGNENYKISLVNEFNNEKQPTFTYIPRNLSYHNAYAKFVLARISDDNCCSNCSGNCMSLDIPCACAGETGGEFAYTPQGLIKEKFLESCVSINQNPQKKDFFYCDDCPLERSKKASASGLCKGHLVRKFIKECWYKCGCGQRCGNRVVQRGITAHLQVFMTPEGKGWGIRTLKDLPKGAFVCEYVGEIVTNTELYDRNTCKTYEKHTYPVLLDADWSSEGVLRDEEALCLDATSFGNVARFINHRCVDANMVEIPVEVESPDHHYYHLAFFTTREVNAFEELTWDYGIDFTDNSHPVKAFKCCCGSKFCRKMKRRKRTRT